MTDRYDPEIHHRRSIRLKGYEYSRAGGYFVTICAHDREHLFGDIVDGEMRLNDNGRIVEEWWRRSATHFPGVDIDRYITMPNHFHGIVIIVGAGSVRPDAGTPKPKESGEPPPPPTLGKIIGYFKYQSAKGVNALRCSPGIPVWQRSYFEHVIRDDADYGRIAEYIDTNPKRWNEDTFYPDNQPDNPDTHKRNTTG
jgi:REP element-mobilizing transposase RayT